MELRQAERLLAFGGGMQRTNTRRATLLELKRQPLGQNGVLLSPKVCAPPQQIEITVQREGATLFCARMLVAPQSSLLTNLKHLFL